MTALDPTTAALAADPKALNDLRRRALTDEAGALRAAAKQFEMLLTDIMMRSMRATVPSDGAMDGEGTKLFTSLLDQEYSKGVAQKGGWGLADLLVKQLSQLREARSQETRAAADM